MSTEIKEYSAIDAAIEGLKEQYGGAIYAVETKDGMKSAVAARSAVKTFRVDIEKIRKQIKQPVLDHGRFIDTEAKRITAELVSIERPIDYQITVEKNRLAEIKRMETEKEEARIADIHSNIEWMRKQLVNALSADAAEIKALYDDVLTFDVKECQEFAADAEVVKTHVVSQLGDAYARATANEKEAAKLKADREQLDQEKAELAASQPNEVETALDESAGSPITMDETSTGPLVESFGQTESLTGCGPIETEAESDERVGREKAERESEMAAIASSPYLALAKIMELAGDCCGYDWEETLEDIKCICRLHGRDS